MEKIIIENRINIAAAINEQVLNLLKTSQNLLDIVVKMREVNLDERAEELRGVTCNLLNVIATDSLYTDSLYDVQCKLLEGLE